MDIQIISEKEKTLLKEFRTLSERNKERLIEYLYCIEVSQGKPMRYNTMPDTRKSDSN